MVTKPSDYVEPFGKAGASGFTFHIEVARGDHTSVEWSSIFSSPLMEKNLCRQLARSHPKH